MRRFLVAGPTASGKTDLAIRLARHYDGVVVNADALQVYRDLPILSASPTSSERARVPHRLFGHVDGAEAYSVGRWLSDVAALPEFSHRTLVFCGGTGLYLKVLCEGLVGTPAIPDRIRQAVVAEHADLGGEGFQEKLEAEHPDVLAHLDAPPDPRRLLRAAEVWRATGKPVAHWQQTDTSPLVSDAFSVILSPERQALYARISARCRRLWTAAVPEVMRLQARGLPSGLPVMATIGFAEISSGASDSGYERFVQRSRQYAKRQGTWLRHQMRPDYFFEGFAEQIDFDSLALRAG